ncbi:unnamed protein product, partial [Tilletia controversa]
RRDSTISPAPQPRQKRTLVDLENEDDEDDDTPSQINNLPSEMQTWAVSVGLKKKAIAELVRFGLLFQAEEDVDLCPLWRYRAHGQMLLLTQLSDAGIRETKRLREDVLPVLKRTKSMVTRIEGDVKELRKAAESKLTEADQLGIHQIAASVFFSADVQTYSEQGDLPRVVSIFLERNPELISPAFAERYKTAEVHFLALISSHIKKKCNNLRSHTRDKIHWSLGVDANKPKLDLYTLYTKLTKSYKVPITKERILRLAYLRKFAAKTNPREVDGDPVDGWWEQVDQSVMKLLSTTRRDAEKGRRILNATYEVDKANFGDFARQEKWISKAGSNDAEISSAFSKAANQN